MQEKSSSSASREKKINGRAVTVLIVVFLFAAAGGMAMLARYSSTNTAVCRSCHPEHTELWEHSHGHPAELTGCRQCHSRKFQAVPDGINILEHYRDQLAPPKYLADDQLTDQRCLDCHEDVLSWDYEVQKKIITFSHRIHAQEGLTCIDCHRTAGHVTRANATNRPTVWECVDCHRKEFQGPPANQKCLNCHDVLLIPGRLLQNNMK